MQLNEKEISLINTQIEKQSKEIIELVKINHEIQNLCNFKSNKYSYEYEKLKKKYDDLEKSNSETINLCNMKTYNYSNDYESLKKQNEE